MIDYRAYYTAYTSPEITERKQEEAKGFLLDRMSATVLGTAGAVGAYYGGAFKVFPNVLDRRLKGTSIYEHTTSSNSKALQSALLTLEELSPLHIAKTLGLSSYQIAFAEVIDKSKRVIISSQSIRAYSDYYKALILNSSGYALKPVDIQNGFIYENNKLYLANRNGTRGREVLGYANFVTANTEIGAQDSPNKVFQKFANRQGVRVHLSQAKLEPLVLIGGKDKASTMLEWHKAFGMFNMEIGLKVLDHPFAFIQETLGNMGINTDEVLRKNKLLTAISNKMDLGLGTNGDYTLGIRKSLYKMSQNIGIKATGAYTSYVTMNWILEKLTPEESTWHDGIFAGLAANYARARVAFAQSWSDAFQGYKEMQEEAAPESTSLLTLLGFPLSGAMVGATAAYAHRMKDTFTKGLEEAALSHTAPEQLEARIRLRGTTLSRYSKLGGLVGAALALPFLPGALIGRSSEELRAEYTGEADVAVRKNRGWLFSSEPWEGGQVKYFRKSLIREIISDARNKTLYENGDQQRDMDPLYSPLEYLRNPYAFEEAHQDDMPTPIWGMEITYGSFLGKLFQTTIGQVIKPTIINPALTGEQDTGAITRYTEGGGISRAYSYPVKETRRDKSLQNAGMMLESPSAVTDQSKEGLVGAYAAASDFAGLKGFFGSLLLKSVGLDPAEQMAPKLQVSGSLNTIVERYQSAQLGDAFGAGEFIRRLMPQSADTKRESVNPLRNKTGNYMCLLEDTDILLWDRTTVKAKNLKVGDSVLSDDGSCQQVVAVATMEAEEWYDISLYGNNCYTYKLSANHPVLVKDKGYIMAEDLLVNDLIAYPRVKYLEESTIIDLLPLQLEYTEVANNFKYDSTYIYSSYGKIKRFWYSEDFFFVLGVYAAEGSKTRNKRVSGVSFAGNATYEKWLKRLSEILTKYEVRYKEVRHLKENRLQVTVSTQLLSGILINTCPGHAKEKHFKFDNLPLMSKGDVKSLLNGLIDGDGYYIKTADNRYKLGLHTTSKQLAYQTYELICSLYGIRPSITEGKIKTGVAYHTTVNGWEDSSTIARDFGYTLYAKHKTKVKYARKNYVSDADYVYTRIKEIHRHVEDVKVYAQEVTGNHTFCLPMMATHNTWLPKDTHRDFGEGSYYHKHEAGYTMLPGTRGFDELHPELKGIDPNDYSDAWKYRILQNVARGSKEHLTYRAHLIKNLDKLSDYDKDVFFTAYEQDMARGEEKKFFEYKTDEERSNLSIPQRLLNTLWENIAHSEPATEMLTPFRPMGKFVHQRSAIEDYQHTQLGGSDVAIWTKPYDHFIKPFINKSIQMVDGDFKPQEAKDKEAIDEYFDKLKYLKSIGFVDTVVEAAYSGMRTEEDMAAFKRALPDNQKAYVEAFSKEKNEEKRKQILALLPSDVGRVYEQIWENIDAYEAGGERAVKDLYLKETETLKRELNIQLSEEEVRRINKRAYKAKNREEEVALQQAALIRSKAAKREAEVYVEETVPSSWIGWDPRLTSDDIKLRTLSVGGEDLQKFGFWKKDIQRNERIIALDGNELDLDIIKKRLREYQDDKHLLKRKLREQGFTVDSISTSAGAGEVNINLQEGRF